jgi:hypothetical protein
LADPRSKRRQKRLAKQKKKRATRSRAGRDQPQGAPDGRATLSSDAAGWPLGPAWLSDEWYERGAEAEVVFTRVADPSRPDSEAAALIAEVQLADEGLRSVVMRAVQRAEHLPGEAARLSEKSGRTMVEVSPAQAVAVLRAAQQLGGELPAAAESFVASVDPADAPLDVLVGEPDAPPPPKAEGWFSRLVGKIVGSP